jgi:hypothetical protein
MPFQLKTPQTGPPGGGPGNTAEPSGELSVGDVVAVVADGEVRLAVAKTTWTPVPGPLTEVRISEHGTRPLPLPGLMPGEKAAPGKEDHGE